MTCTHCPSDLASNIAPANTTPKLAVRFHFANDAHHPGLELKQGLLHLLGLVNLVGIVLGVEGLAGLRCAKDQDLRQVLTLALQLPEAILDGRHELLGDTRLHVTQQLGTLELHVQKHVRVLADAVVQALDLLDPVQLDLLLQ